MSRPEFADLVYAARNRSLVDRIARYEDNASEPPIWYIVAVARVRGLSVERLLGSGNQLLALHDAVQALPASCRAAALDALRRMVMQSRR